MKTSLMVGKCVSAAIVAGAAMFFATGCSASVSVGGSDQVTKPEGAPAGTCVTLSGSEAQTMTVKKTDCGGGAELSFYSAGSVAKSASCATNNYSPVTFPGSDTKLCLALNLTEGKCYQINPSNIVDYRRIDCGAAATDGATVYKVASRVDGTATCSAGQLPVNYTQPKAIGYCLEKS